MNSEKIKRGLKTGLIIVVVHIIIVMLAFAGLVVYIIIDAGNEMADRDIAKDEGFKILDSQSSIDEYGRYKVTGTVKNDCAYNVSYMSISVRFYDIDGVLLGTKTDHMYDVDSYEKWRFEVKYRGSEMPSNYKVEKESVY